MKKLILSAIALVLVGGACCVEANAADKAKLTPEEKALQKEFKALLKEANNKSKTDEFAPTPADLPAARVAIEKAAKMSLAEGNAEFYTIAGKIEEETLKKAQQENDFTTYASSGLAGFQYYSKAYNAALADNQKKFIQPAQQGALFLYQATGGLVNAGGAFYQVQEYQKSIEAFRTAIAATKEPVLTSNPLAALTLEQCSADTTINSISYSIFQVAFFGLQDTVTANKELIYLKDHTTDTKLLNQYLQMLAQNYYAADQMTDFENTLKEGMQRIPEESWYIRYLIQTYIDKKDYTSAKGFLDKAMESDPKNVVFLNTKGWLLETEGNADEALKYYEKAYAIDPSDYSINASLGRYYFNQAQEIIDKYEKLKKWEEGDRQAEPVIEKALSYYEAAFALDTERKDKNICFALRGIYGPKIAKLGLSSPAAKPLKAKYAEISEAYGLESNF
ncbi:MAG: tetratricopeptide repeat protein [Bacteroidales bacterium]|nr:tetratricopeptide repeat protein [Candidatus Liminaster caballi]